MSNPNKIIVGAVVTAAAIAAAIDHTRHKLPEPVAAEQINQSSIVIEDEEEASPCSLDSGGSDDSNEIVVEDESASPCGLGD